MDFVQKSFQKVSNEFVFVLQCQIFVRYFSWTFETTIATAAAATTAATSTTTITTTQQQQHLWPVL
jgi:hypothetical protein